MAVGNAIVQTAKFQPLSYDEWAKPILALNKAHAETEEALWNLQDEASEYKQYILEHPNSEVAKQYTSYIDELDKQASILATEGITPQSRTALNNLRLNYKNKVQPVKSAVERFKADEKLIQQDRAKGVIGKEHSIEDYLNDTNYSYSYILGDNVTKDFAEAFATLAESTISAPEFQAKVGGSQYWQVMQVRGYNQADILNAVMHNPDLAPEVYEAIPDELKSVATSLRGQYGYDKLSEEEKSMFDAYAYKGALSGMQRISYNLQANKGYESPSQAYALHKARQAQKEKDQIIKHEVKDEKGNVISTYYTFNEYPVELNSSGKWIYYGTQTEQDPNGVAIGSKQPTYKGDTAANSSITEEQYQKELAKLPATSVLIDEDGDFAESKKIEKVIAEGSLYDWDALTEDMKNRILRECSYTAGEALKEAINRGVYEIRLYNGEPYLIRK